jgi:large subunit ribosomal protein L23
MALFGRKKTQDTKAAVVAPALSAEAAPSGVWNDLAHVLRNPRITEKATAHQEIGVYTFDVHVSATKSQIAHAVRALYGITPRKVRVVSVPVKKKRNVRTGASGFASGGRKAYVYLKKGETITIG